MYELTIKNASIIDGTGKPPFVTDIAISGGRIVRVGECATDTARVIDAHGLALTPGFIDSHSHGDYALLTGVDHRDAVEQGITFAVGGQCGSSAAPSPGDSQYATMGAFAARLENVPLSTNFGILAGHGTLRQITVGNENRPVTAKELAQMRSLLEQSIDEGSMGLSLGLTYPPGSYADRAELIALAEVVGQKGGILTAHIRNESDEVIESAQEFITICQQGGCRGILSHLKAADKPNHGKVAQLLSMLEDAQSRGVQVYADAYPYCASSTTLQARFVPRQFHPPGTKNVTALLDDPAICERIKRWATEKWGTDLGWVLVTFCAGHPEYTGMTINEIADAMGIADRYEAVFALLRSSMGKCHCCFTMMSPEDVSTVLAHPLVMIGCDADPGNTATLYHPRRRGTFPRILGKYVREENITTLPEMIRKMTALPAEVYRIPNKGRITEGYDADICLFDPEKIRDTADYVNCSSPNEGLHYVIIGGKAVVENGTYNGIRAGKLLTR